MIAGLFGLASLAAGAAEAEPSATARGLAGHRAVYEIALARRTDRSDVVDAKGRLVFEFSGNACDGWSSRFRLVTTLVNADGSPRVSDMRTSSFEDGDGRAIEFVNQTLVGGKTLEDTKGTAAREGGAIRVTISGAVAPKAEIAGVARFPTEHMVAILEAAKAGRTVSEIDLYDGSEGGARVFHTTVVIGHEQAGPDDTTAEPAAAGAPTAGLRRWPVDISYFDPAKGTTDATPEYQLGFILYENGISRRLRLDYGDFALAGTMTSLEALPSGPCR
jgi:hypothetical protein